MAKYSSASFASLRSELKARATFKKRALSFEEILNVIKDLIPPAIDRARRYQTLQALVNCTRRSLLPDPSMGEEQRQVWEKELRALEAEGIQ
jgi:hypothetical protein